MQFFDLNGLTDRVATDSPVFASVPRSTAGTRGVLVHFIRNREEVEAEPGFVVPDLFVYQYYDNYRLPDPVFAGMGYVVVYDQAGEVSSGSRHFPGQRIWANQLVAVRRDLVPELSELPPERLDIRSIGIVRVGSAW